MTRGKKILTGCLVAIAIMVLAVILTVVFFVSWLKTPSPDLEGRRLLHESTDLYAELRLRRDDQAVRDLLRVFLEGHNRNAFSEIENSAPPAMGKFLPLFKQLSGGDVGGEDLDKALPLAIILTSSRSEPGMAPPLFAINFPASGHTLTLVDWILARTISGDSKDLQVQWHGDEAIYVTDTDPPVWGTIVDTDVLLSTSEEAVLSGIKRLRRPPVAIAGTPLQALLDEAPQDAALTLAAQDGGAGTLLALASEHFPALADILDQRMSQGARVSGWARLESQDRLTGSLLVMDPAAASDRLPEAEELSTYTLELLDGTVRVTLADKGMDSASRHEWAFTLEGTQALALWAAERSMAASINISP